MSAFDELDKILAAAQAERRLPSVSAAVFRDDDVVWERAIGLADVERGEEASPVHAYRIGSITKTFTAACVLQLRDAGLVELDAPLQAYIAEAPGGPTVRQACRTCPTRVLDPLGLARTTFEPSGPTASGYLVDPYSDLSHPEPDLEMIDSTAALGQLWSTSGDLAVWGAFLAEGREGVLGRATLDEMARVQTMADQTSWTLGWGLGLELSRRGDRVFAGHGGAMPGFLAGLAVDRAERTGAAVLTSASTGAKAEELALDLACAALEALTREPTAWRPDTRAPADIEPLLGRWWIAENELVLSYRNGRFQADLIGGPIGRTVSWFVQEGADRFRVAEGRERGEPLQVVRDGHGAVVKLYFATYPVTRSPQTFAED